MFRGHPFGPSIILLCVRWYLAYGSRLCNPNLVAAKRGLTRLTPPVSRLRQRRSAAKLLPRYGGARHPPFNGEDETNYSAATGSPAAGWCGKAWTVAPCPWALPGSSVAFGLTSQRNSLAVPRAASSMIV